MWTCAERSGSWCLHKGKLHFYETNAIRITFTHNPGMFLSTLDSYEMDQTETVTWIIVHLVVFCPFDIDLALTSTKVPAAICRLSSREFHVFLKAEQNQSFGAFSSLIMSIFSPTLLSGSELFIPWTLLSCDETIEYRKISPPPRDKTRPEIMNTLYPLTLVFSVRGIQWSSAAG